MQRFVPTSMVLLSTTVSADIVASLSPPSLKFFFNDITNYVHICECRSLLTNNCSWFIPVYSEKSTIRVWYLLYVLLATRSRCFKKTCGAEYFWDILRADKVRLGKGLPSHFIKYSFWLHCIWTS